MKIKALLHKTSAMWILMFCVMFCTPFLTYPFAKRLLGDEQNIENRAKPDRPELNLGNYQEYPALYTDYFDDEMPYRDMLIRCKGSIMYNLFGESASDQVVAGSEGWLFFECTLPEYKRINLYTQEELKEICRKLENAQRYFEERGISFLILIGPNKIGIYGEDYLPGNILRQPGLSRTLQLIAYLEENTNLTVVFPQEELISAKEQHPEYPLYFHRDTHWNYLGGYYGAKALLSELGIALPEFDELTLTQVNEPLFSWYGYDLENMMGMTGMLHEDMNYHVAGYTDNDVTRWQELKESREEYEGVYRIVNPEASDERKVMLVRDSFGSCVLPYLAVCFSEVYSPGYGVYYEASVDEEQPDIVIYEWVERDTSWRVDVLPQ